MLILAEEEEEGGDEAAEELDNTQMELSAVFARGLTSPKTLKLRGCIGGREVLVLIDSGANHNFIQWELVEEMRLAVIDTMSYCVSLGDGYRKESRGCCKQVRIEMGGAEVAERFYLFELGGVDMILGIEWLGKLGEVTMGWGKSTMMYQ